MVTGEPKAVAERLLEMKDLAQADEIVAVTPSLDRERRIGSYVALGRRLAQCCLTPGRPAQEPCAGGLTRAGAAPQPGTLITRAW